MSKKTSVTSAKSASATETESTNGMGIEIEDGIEIPPYRTRARYPFDQLKPGNSFVIPRPIAKASVTVSYWKKKLQENNPDIDFTIRSIDENSSRVWRIDGFLEKVEKLTGVKK